MATLTTPRAVARFGLVLKLGVAALTTLYSQVGASWQTSHWQLPVGAGSVAVGASWS